LLEGIPAERRQSVRAHKVSEGETLASIARRYKVPETSLVTVNGNLDDGLQAGDLLLVPVPNRAERKVSQTSRARAAARASSRTASRPALSRKPSHTAGTVRTASANPAMRSRNTARR
jgi:LysM repeat protein